MLLGWGILFIVVGSAFHELAIARILYPDGSPMPPSGLLVTRVLNLAMIAWGSVTIFLRHRMIVKKINLALFSLLVIGPVAAEAGLRLSFCFEKSPTRDPALFGNYFYDDDYWRLQMMWKAAPVERTKDHIHPLLGWSQGKITEQNPWGLREESRNKMVDDGQRKILFYGDSFVAGAGDVDHRLPAYMEKRMSGVQVADLGVGGFGTDQAFLLFRETWRLAGGKPPIIMGVLTEDLDRALLSIRTAPKVRLGPDATDSLQPRNPPLPRDANEWLEAHPLRLRSYLASLVLTRLRPVTYNPRRNEVMSLNRRIIASVHEIAKREGLDLLYVIFYGEGAMQRPDWREDFIKDELRRRSIRHLDTRAPIEAHCARTGTPLAALYHENGHHNDLGNEVIGDALIGAMAPK